MGIKWTDESQQSNGGTERMGRMLESVIDPDLMDNFQIVASRLRGDLDETKIRIFWAHDMPEDPESAHLANDGWRQYHRLVFVSHFQMQGYIRRFSIPWTRCQVMQNAIEPIVLAEDKPSEPLRLIYHSTPHRGLNILVPVFDKLCETNPDIELDIYSSFNLYGWGDNDEKYKPLFESMASNPKIRNHGTVPNEEIRTALGQSHIFAYPCTWTETSCLCLIEAMSAGLLCVHPTLGALPETAANWTMMYQWEDDTNRHAAMFYHTLANAIDVVRSNKHHGQLSSQRAYTNVFYSWQLRKLQWETFLQSLLQEPREIEKPKAMFNYRA